jgi:glycosyltransferase involved in cell wall biosynthesis
MPRRRYRFGFVLTTGAGNLTRYQNLRRYAELDRDVECVWATDPTTPNARTNALQRRLTALRCAAPVLGRLGRFDAVVFHGFEPYVLATLRGLVARRPLVMVNDDAGPSADPRFWEGYGLVGRSALRARARFELDAFCARRAALHFPYTRWAAAPLVEDCGVPAERVHPLNVGIDLERWPYARRGEDAAPERPKILFVGGDFARKGGPLLVDVFRRRFAAVAELHLVTREPPPDLPPGASIHADLVPNDPRLRALYAEADLFVLPTRADLSSFAVLEAMATGLPVVATRVGGITEIVRDGTTGYLVAPDDAAALADRIELLLGDPARRRRMGAEGRAVVEDEYNAAVNVPRMLDLMKAAVDAA